MKTTGERPLLEKKSCQDAAYLQLAGCRLSWPMGNQVHIPHHHPQQRQRRSAEFTLPGSSRDLIARTRARPRSHPERAHPARQAHQPLGPGTANRPRAASTGTHRGASAGWRSLHRSSRWSQHLPNALVPQVTRSKVCQPSQPPAFKGGRRPGALPAFQEVGPSRGPKLPSKLKVSSYRVEGRPQSPPAVHRRPTHARPISSGPKRLTPQECFAPCQCSPSM